MQINQNVTVGPFVEACDAERLFGPLAPTDKVIHYASVGTRLGMVLKDLGLFKSRGEAKRNGFDGEIQYGYSEIIVGKRRNLIGFWKPAYGLCPQCSPGPECKCTWEGLSCACKSCAE